jgi:hypothetical protein
MDKGEYILDRYIPERSICFLDYDGTLALGIHKAVAEVLNMPEINSPQVKYEASQNPEKFIKKYAPYLEGVTDPQIVAIWKELDRNDDVIKYVNYFSSIGGNSIHILTENPLVDHMYRLRGMWGIVPEGIYPTYPLEMDEGRLVVPKGAVYTPKTDIARRILQEGNNDLNHSKACIITDGGGLDKQLEPHLIENGFPIPHNNSKIGRVNIIYLSR